MREDPAELYDNDDDYQASLSRYKACRYLRDHELDDHPACSCCGATEALGRSGDEEVLCPGCLSDSLREGSRRGAREFAAAHVRLTCHPSEVPSYDPEREFAPTPEEYEAGFREAHTENSVRAVARHRCTNYEDLIAPLTRGGPHPVDDTYYWAIRERAEEVVGMSDDA